MLFAWQLKSSQVRCDDEKALQNTESILLILLPQQQQACSHMFSTEPATRMVNLAVRSGIHPAARSQAYTRGCVRRKVRCPCVVIIPKTFSLRGLADAEQLAVI